MSVKKVKTEITYRVPAGHYCNLGKTTELCRFCIKEKHGYRCALYNDTLSMENSATPLKTRDCVKAMCGFKSVVEDIPDAEPPAPKKVIKLAIDEYVKMYKQLIKQGYPSAIAEKLAKDYMIGDN